MARCACTRRTPSASAVRKAIGSRLTTRRGTAHARLEFGSDLQPGHVALPNGHGLDYTAADGTTVHKGVSLNELTDTTSRDPIAGTPWHKHVPVRIERAAVQQDVDRSTHGSIQRRIITA